MLAVVYLHVAAPALRQFDAMQVWHFSNVFTALCTIAVPIFFMMSGALLLSDAKTTDIFYLFRYRLPHILVPFILWSLLNVAYMSKIEHVQTAKQAVFSILSQPVVIPYWYLYALIPLYLLSPILKKLVDTLTSKQLLYILLLWGVTSVLLPTVQRLLPPHVASYLVMHESYNLKLDGGYIGYFFLGYVLDQMKTRYENRVLVAVIGMDLLLITTATWYVSVGTGKYSEQFKSYLSLYCVILAAAVFLLVKNLCAERNTQSRFLLQLSGVSYCIYLVHVKIITTIHLFVMKQHFETILSQLVFYGLTVAGSLACAFVFASVKPFCWPLTGQKYQMALNLQACLRRK